MKRKKIVAFLVILAVFGIALSLCGDDITQKYYRSADPMVEAYREHREVFHAAAEVLSGFSRIGRIGIEKEPMEYIRNYYACEHIIDGYSILTDAPLEEAEYERLFTAVSAVMDVTDVSEFFMNVDDAQGICIRFVFYYDYGIYANLYYFEFEHAQEAFPYTPAHPKDIQKIDSHWFACLSTDTFMAD